MVESVLKWVSACVFAYLVGSIPTAVWISRWWYGKDIRQYGSGNPGSTNMYRVFGFKAGLLTQIIDIAKGYVAAYLSSWMELPGDPLRNQLLVGLCAVIGHIYTVLANWKGGKGVNTLLGVMLRVEPMACLVGIVVFLIVLLLGRMVSLASMSAVLSFPVYLLVLHFGNEEPLHPFLFPFSLLLVVLIVYTHRSNIRRILRGEENKVNFVKSK